MTNRGRYTIGSVTRPGTDESCEETFACCSAASLCHAGASHRSLSSTRFQYGTLARLRWNSVFANAHRNVYNNFGLARSDKIMGGLRQEDLEAFLHVTMVAITLTGILQQFRNQEVTHHTRLRVTCCSTASAPTGLKNTYLKFAVTMRRGVLNNMSSEILNSAVPRETCRWPTVCPRLDHAPTT